MEANENISFAEALSNEYAQFPITGFSNNIQEKSNALSRYWLTIPVVLFISYFEFHLLKDLRKNLQKYLVISSYQSVIGSIYFILFYIAFPLNLHYDD